MGIFDEGCMGMYNAIIPDENLMPTGRVQGTAQPVRLYAAMREVPEEEARAVRAWLDRKGMKFHTGPNPETDLTDAQILDQCRMYIAALRIADDFGCDAIGIQYQQGLEGPGAGFGPGGGSAEQCRPAAGEGRRQRPRALRRPAAAAFQRSGRMRRAGCAGHQPGLDASSGTIPETTLHDVRYGEAYGGEFVWVFRDFRLGAAART